MRRLALILAFVLALCGSAVALMPRGAGPASSGLNALQTTIHNAAANSWTQLNAAGSHTDGACGFFGNDQLQGTLANFDGGPGANATFRVPVGAFNNPMGGTGANGTGCDSAFSSADCDLSVLKCVLWMGGHIDGGDGSIYVFDITAAATARNASSRGHWTIPNGLKSGRYIPMTEPQPANNPQIYNTLTDAAFTATFNAGDTQMTVTSGISGLHNGYWIKGPGISAGAYVQVTGCPGGYYSSSPCTTSPVAVTCLATCFSSNQSGVTMHANTDYWVTTNAAGTLMPIISHSYYYDRMIPGTTKAALGGDFPFSASPQNDNQGYFVTDYSAGTTAVNNGVSWGSQGSPCYNSLDTNFYLWSGTELQKTTASSLTSAPSYSNVVASSQTATARTQTICMADPVNGSGHEAVFQQDVPDSGNAFNLFTDVSGTPAYVHPTFATTISSVFTQTNTQFRAWTGGDGTFMYAWEGTGKFYKLLTPSNTSNWTLSEVTGGTATGDIPQWGGVQQALTLFDLGLTYCHAALALGGGDVYIYKPTGCSL